MMAQYFAYFHINDTHPTKNTMGHLHDGFVSKLPRDTRVAVGWGPEKNKNSLRYHVQIDSPYEDDGRVGAAFRALIATVESELWLATLLSKKSDTLYSLIDLKS